MYVADIVTSSTTITTTIDAQSESELAERLNTLHDAMFTFHGPCAIWVHYSLKGEQQ